MASGEAGESSRSSSLPHVEDDDAVPLAGFWPALLVALVAALIAWLWYGRGDGKEDGKEKVAPATAPPQPHSEREAPAADQEPLQKSVGSETKQRDTSYPQEPVENQWVLPAECTVPSLPKDLLSSEPLLKESTTLLTNYKEYAKDEIISDPAEMSDSPASQESTMHSLSISAEPSPSSEEQEEKCKEQLQHNSFDHMERDIVSERSSWDGDASQKSNIENGNCKDLDQAKRVAAVSPMPQTVHVTFRVHYITHSEAQLIAITGNHECLGQWQHYVPLRCDINGFWSDSVILPVDTRVEWKFILVENGKVRRWEECDNRTLMTDHEDRVAHRWWGYH